ncbi:MAG: DegT/DnrJ/EryC1/StrS family aminotransferase [Elusimicrobia bacterium]|nr:DegT/DnrJ/EryC1/StrS family aminotransferase [Elusimicrobiota bacterium]
METIPLVDLKAQDQSIRAEIGQALAPVLASQHFVLGPAVESFEREFAAYLGVKYCVGVSSGTSALWLLLKACGVGPGDEVVTTPLTFFATVEAILLCGAKPVFADVEPRTLNLDPVQVEKVLTSKTKVILPVHLYGQPADMANFRDLSRRRGLILLEDAAQAAGSLYKGRKAGSLARAAAFSFYPGKNLGAYGDAGAVATDDEALARALRALRNHGSEKKNYHDALAGNERMADVQAAVLSAKLAHLDLWNAARRRHAQTYRQALAGLAGLSFVEEEQDRISNCHLFVVRHARRDALLAKLQALGIQADVHYPRPAHLQPALGPWLGREGDFPEAEKAASEILSLPLYPELEAPQLSRVAEAARVFCRGAP